MWRCEIIRISQLQRPNRPGELHQCNTFAFIGALSVQLRIDCYTRPYACCMSGTLKTHQVGGPDTCCTRACMSVWSLVAAGCGAHHQLGAAGAAAGHFGAVPHRRRGRLGHVARRPLQVLLTCLPPCTSSTCTVMPFFPLLLSSLSMSSTLGQRPGRLMFCMCRPVLRVPGNQSRRF